MSSVARFVSMDFHPFLVCRPHDHKGVIRDRLRLVADYTPCCARAKSQPEFGGDAYPGTPESNSRPHFLRGKTTQEVH